MNDLLGFVIAGFYCYLRHNEQKDLNNTEIIWNRMATDKNNFR